MDLKFFGQIVVLILGSLALVACLTGWSHRKHWWGRAMRYCGVLILSITILLIISLIFGF